MDSLQILSLFQIVSVSATSGLPRWLSDKESACQCRRHRRYEIDPLVRKIPWSGKWQPALCSCLENSMDRGSWWVTVHGVLKSQTRRRDWAHRNAWNIYLLSAQMWLLLIDLCLCGPVPRWMSHANHTQICDYTETLPYLILLILL